MSEATKAQKAAAAAKRGAWASWTKGKKGFDWLWQKSQPVGDWMNKQAGKLGMESVWPTTLDKECDKCARILWTFTQRTAHSNHHPALPSSSTQDPYASRKKQKMPIKIPESIIRDAQGLAIFTVWRTGLGFSAASGSGVVIARDSPTSWGPPSGLLVHTIGVGFLAGMDVYDAVLVLRTRKAVDAFAKPKVSIGAEVSVAAGPVGNSVGFDLGKELAPVLVYSKSKGIYGGLQLDGNIIIERQDENARFYGHKIKAVDILAGGHVAFPASASGLLASIAAAEGQPIDINELPEHINVSPSDLSRGHETQVDHVDHVDHGDHDMEEDRQTNTNSSPPLSGKRLSNGGGYPIPTSVLSTPLPSEEDQDKEEEKIRKRQSAPPFALIPTSTSTSTSTSTTLSDPPFRPPRRFIPTSSSTSPSQSPEPGTTLTPTTTTTTTTTLWSPSSFASSSPSWSEEKKRYSLDEVGMAKRFTTSKPSGLGIDYLTPLSPSNPDDNYNSHTALDPIQFVEPDTPTKK